MLNSEHEVYVFLLLVTSEVYMTCSILDMFSKIIPKCCLDFSLDAELTQYENAEDMARPEEERITEAEKNITLQKQLEVKPH